MNHETFLAPLGSRFKPMEGLFRLFNAAGLRISVPRPAPLTEQKWLTLVWKWSSQRYTNDWLPA